MFINKSTVEIQQENKKGRRMRSDQGKQQHSVRFEFNDYKTEICSLK